VTTEVYRFYNDAGHLLYVGITDNWPARFHEHAKKSAWYKEARRIDLKPFDSREDALAEELSAIHNEDPLWNINGSAKASATEHYKKIVEWVESENWFEPYHEVIVQELGEALNNMDIGVWNFPESWQNHRKLYAPEFVGFVTAMAPFGLIPCEVCIRAASHGTITNWASEVVQFETDFVNNLDVMA
jgi:hypothetical protein